MVRFDITKKEREILYKKFSAMRGVVASEIEEGHKFYNDFPEIGERNNGIYFSQKLKTQIKFKDSEAKPPKPKIPEIKREEIIMPGLGKLISVFAKEVSDEIKDKNEIFFRHSSKEIVEIGKIKDHKTNENIYTGFMEIKPNRFITLIEKYIIPGHEIWNDKQKFYEFKKKSIGSQLSVTLLTSEILQQELPQINRIFTIPLPIKHEGKLTFPKRGYDERFNSWLPYNAPEISNPNMSVEEAKKLLAKIHKEFCFCDKQDYTNAIAALLTPFLRGLFPTFSTRTPISFYLANRERAGKDYLAGVVGITYEGYDIEESPISNSENSRSNNTEELRKKLLAAMINGRKRLHFANNKGYINNAVFEAVTTAEKYSDRQLGKNDILTFDNEIDYSLSGNVGVGFTPDFANRSRFIRLHLDIEDANARSFDNPNLHKWISENREIILSALYALVRNWMEKGEKKGSVNFASFPIWAEICGGIMEEAGYESPCSPDKETLALGGDSETQDMKQLFEMCFQRYPNQWIQKSDIKDLINREDGSLFAYFDFDKRGDQTKFGNKISRFVGRVLSDIRLMVKDSKIRASRQELKFTKDKIELDKSVIFDDFGDEVTTLYKGNGNSGIHHLPIDTSEKINSIGSSVLDTKVDRVTKKEQLFTDKELEKAGYNPEDIKNMINTKNEKNNKKTM